MIGWLYTLTVLGIAVFGLHMALLLLLAWLSRRPVPARADGTSSAPWPRVLVQIPLYNERTVVERVIAAAAAFDYPRERLLIQILDDSTDETAPLARALTSRWAAVGAPIAYVHRRDRSGFKAGALAAGLALAREAEYVAIFDADFVPPPDILKRWLAAFKDQPRLGLVQGRWEHLNGAANWVAQAQTLMFDSYFAVDQVARSANGLLMNFNGSAGMWRRACIDDAGGWQGDTLAEDLDLSYRAQIKGWRLAYRAEISAPAELPTSLMAFRQQQFRWAQGSFQVFRKLGVRLLRARLGWPRKILGALHILGYLPHVLLVLSLGLSLPLAALGGFAPVHWSALSWLAIVPFVVAAWGQWALAPARGETRWRALGRMWVFPFLTLIFLGLAWSTTVAFIGALAGRGRAFERTPKQGDGTALYSVRTDRFLGEFVLALYAAFSGWLALQRVPELAPVLFLYATSFGLTVLLGLFEQRVTGRQSRAESA
ncbi:MAG TPA: glycosyltransferase [Anaerolineales bacterium]|nr:glycosyltransferase [Anaerolineales bacterium]